MARDQGSLAIEETIGWGSVKVILTNRRLVFEGATWQVGLREIEEVRVERRFRRWFAHLLDLIPLIELFYIPRVGMMRIGLGLADGRKLILYCPRRRTALAIVEAVKKVQQRHGHHRWQASLAVYWKVD